MPMPLNIILAAFAITMVIAIVTYDPNTKSKFNTGKEIRAGVIDMVFSILKSDKRIPFITVGTLLVVNAPIIAVYLTSYLKDYKYINTYYIRTTAVWCVAWFIYSLEFYGLSLINFSDLCGCF